MRKCSVVGCFNAKAKSDCRDKTFFKFPLKKAQLLKVWLKNIGRQGFMPSSNSVICSDHFQENSFIICQFTKRRLLKPGSVPIIFRKTLNQIPKIGLPSTPSGTNGNKLQPDGTKPILSGAVPSIFPNSPAFTSSGPSNVRANPDDKGKTKEMEGLKAGTVSLQKQVKKEECEQISTIPEPHEKLNSHKPVFLTLISNNRAIILLPFDENQAPTAISGIESQNVAETSNVIKQEPVESVDEPPRLIIKNIHRAELASSSSCGSAPLPENALPFANPDSTNVGETPAAHIPNKPAQKRKINDAEPDAAQAKLCRRTIPSLPSKRNSKQHPPAGTSPKSAGRSTLPTKNDENATREMFQSLLDSSENNPLFGSRTTERPGDLFDVFADFIAEKLRGMDWDDCAYALRAILDVVFKTGKAQDDSE